MGGKSSDLVTEALGRDDGDLIADLLVRVAVGENRSALDPGVGRGSSVQVKSKTGVVLLDNDTRGALDGLGANSAPARRKHKQRSEEHTSELQSQ